MGFGVNSRHGDDGLGGGDPGSASPEVGAGVQGGEPPIQPGVADQSREAVDGGQYLAALPVGAEGMSIFWFICELFALAASQCLLEGMGGQLGGASTAGHDVNPLALGIRPHRSLGAKAFHEALVELLFPAPQPGMGAQASGSPEQPGILPVAST